MLQVAEKSPRARGSVFEALALAYLSAHGCKLVARNVVTRVGELDLVVRDGETLVIVEVRYRQSLEFGHPFETVNLGKQRRIARATAVWLARRPLMATGPMRFDIVAVTGPVSAPHIEWIRDAFQPSDGVFV